MRKLSEVHRRKIGLSKLGKKRAPFSLEWREKLKKASLGNQYALGIKLTPEQCETRSRLMKGRKNANHGLTIKRILTECEELEKQGFRAIPTGWKIIPDIIALKDNKVFAVEVEYGRPNYSKYTNEIQRYYDDVIWIIKKPVKETA